MRSSDGKTRDLVTTQSGAGWDYSQTRHPYFEIERPLKPHYCLYNRRHMAVLFDTQPVDHGYWLLRQKAGVLHTGELPLQFPSLQYPTADPEELPSKLESFLSEKNEPFQAFY